MPSDTKYLIIAIAALIVWNTILTVLVIALGNDMWGRLGLIARFGRL
jgi:hypothetical protein